MSLHICICSFTPWPDNKTNSNTKIKIKYAADMPFLQFNGAESYRDDLSEGDVDSASPGYKHFG